MIVLRGSYCLSSLWLLSSTLLFPLAPRRRNYDQIVASPIVALSDDSGGKPYECFDEAQHERKISNDFRSSSLPVLWQTGVRPEALEG